MLINLWVVVVVVGTAVGVGTVVGGIVGATMAVVYKNYFVVENAVEDFDMVGALTFVAVVAMAAVLVLVEEIVGSPDKMVPLAGEIADNVAAGWAFVVGNIAAGWA